MPSSGGESDDDQQKTSVSNGEEKELTEEEENKSVDNSSNSIDNDDKEEKVKGDDDDDDDDEVVKDDENKDNDDDNSDDDIKGGEDNSESVAAAAAANCISTPSKKHQQQQQQQKTPAKKKTPPSKKRKPESNKQPSSAKKDTAAPSSSSSSSKITYFQMVQKAIVALKDRTGSSAVAIQKYILANFDSVDPAVLKSRLNMTLKTAVKQQKLQKIRASFKIHPEFRKKEQNQKRRMANKLKQQQQQQKQKQLLKEKEKEKQKEKEKIKKKKSLSPAQIAAQKEKERLEALERQRQELIRKRKFPMEDLELIAQDKELRVSPPDKITSRPSLSSLEPLPIATKASSDIVLEVLHVYHVFRGHVQVLQQDVAPFTLSHWIQTVSFVQQGHAKTCRALPPLLTHLFVVALQHLTYTNFPKLYNGLDSTSWSEIVLLYMDAMERYSTTEASLHNQSDGSKIILTGSPIDTNYLFGHAEEDAQAHAITDPFAVPVGPSYLAPQRLAKAHCKLLTHDPWMLTMEELLALLTALCDDLVGTLPHLETDMNEHNEKVSQLLKAKRAAEANYRKLQNAYNKQTEQQQQQQQNGNNTKNGNGSKKKGGNNGKNDNDNKKSTEKDNTNNNNDNNNSDDDGTGGEKEGKKDQEESTTTSTLPPPPKQQQSKSKSRASSSGKGKIVSANSLEAAKRAAQKAATEYEKASRMRVIRTEPIGYDRHYNAYYHCMQDPEIILLEQRGAKVKSSNQGIEEPVYKTSWYMVTTKSIVNSLLSSLDVRGQREHDLHEQLSTLKKFMYDDVKEINAMKSLLKEKEEAKRQMENAKAKCGVGRKSGRLAGKAEEELVALQAEMESIQQRIDAKPTDSNGESDYVMVSSATGLDVLKQYEGTGPISRKRTTRQDVKQQKQDLDSSTLPRMICSKLWCSKGSVSREGVVGMLVSELLRVEERCEKLAPWDLQKMGIENSNSCSSNNNNNSNKKSIKSRDQWKGELETSISLWNSISPVVEKIPTNVVATPAGDAKRRKVELSSPITTASSTTNVTPTPSQVLTLLKQPLLDLEARVFDMTGLAMAARDADEADDNMSTTSNEETKDDKLETKWKKIIFRLYNLPAKASTKIRQCLVEGIAAARKAHLPAVVAELRSALLQFHPEGAGGSKTTAIKILERHGGYEPAKGYDEEEEDEDEDDVAGSGAMKDEDSDTGFSSLLCAEAVVLNSSMDGQEDASRTDWIDAVKKCKTFSKLASFVISFCRKAGTKLNKLESEYEALLAAVEAWENPTSVKKKKANGKDEATTDPSEIWADVIFTDEFCMAKVEDYPWWPARQCIAKNEELKESLEKMNRIIVSLVGESGSLRFVAKENIRPYSPESAASKKGPNNDRAADEGEEEDDDEAMQVDEIKDEKSDGIDDKEGPTEESTPEPVISKGIRIQLEECMTMARRIIRGKSKKKKGKGGVKTVDTVEEKKLST